MHFKRFNLKKMNNYPSQFKIINYLFKLKILKCILINLTLKRRSSSSQFKILNPYKLRYFKQTKIREED